MRRRRNGFGLVSVLVASAIMLILASVLAVNLFQEIQVAQANTVASSLERIEFAESSYNTLFGSGYTTPTTLGLSNLTLPVTCNNPELLPGQDAILDIQGYAISFNGGAPASGCSLPTFQTFSMTATPSVTTGRYFFLDASGALHFSDGSPATIASPLYPLAQPARQTVSTLIVATAANANSSAPTPPGGNFSNVQLNITGSFSGAFPTWTGSLYVAPGSGTFSGTLTANGSPCGFSGNLGAGGSSNVSVGCWGQTFVGMGSFANGDFTFYSNHNNPGDQNYVMVMTGTP